MLLKDPEIRPSINEIMSSRLVQNHMSLIVESTEILPRNSLLGTTIIPKEEAKSSKRKKMYIKS